MTEQRDQCLKILNEILTEGPITEEQSDILDDYPELINDCDEIICQLLIVMFKRILLRFKHKRYLIEWNKSMSKMTYMSKKIVELISSVQSDPYFDRLDIILVQETKIVPLDLLTFFTNGITLLIGTNTNEILKYVCDNISRIHVISSLEFCQYILRIEELLHSTPEYTDCIKTEEYAICIKYFEQFLPLTLEQKAAKLEAENKKLELLVQQYASQLKNIKESLST